METGLGVAAFEERLRDTHSFGRRVGRLPEQREGDSADFRPLLHRDGSVLSAVSLKVRNFCLVKILRSLWAGLEHSMAPGRDVGTFLLAVNALSCQHWH